MICVYDNDTDLLFLSLFYFLLFPQSVYVLVLVFISFLFILWITTTKMTWEDVLAAVMCAALIVLLFLFIAFAYSSEKQKWEARVERAKKIITRNPLCPDIVDVLTFNEVHHSLPEPGRVCCPHACLPSVPRRSKTVTTRHQLWDRGSTSDGSQVLYSFLALYMALPMQWPYIILLLVLVVSFILYIQSNNY